MNTVNHVICVKTSEGDHQGQAGFLGSRELEKLPFSLLSQLPCGSCSIDPVRETLFGSLILGFLSFTVIVDEKEKKHEFFACGTQRVATANPNVSICSEKLQVSTVAGTLDHSLQI